jgi:NAD(P)-dependent dehydrogenase (short-subunit alcohol dehydrogenase family)
MAYGTSKAGLINLTRGLARALAPDVRVNAVAPGLVQTPWTDPWTEERKRGTRCGTLLARLATPTTIAETMPLLAAGGLHHGETDRRGWRGGVALPPVIPGRRRRARNRRHSRSRVRGVVFISSRSLYGSGPSLPLAPE